MPLIPRPKYRAKDWRLAMRTRERNEARRVACEQYTRANKLEEKNIELWATKMKLEQERDELYVSWQADHNSLELTHSINKKLHKRTLELKRERDSCKVSISIWTTSRDYWKSRAEKAEQERDTANHRLDECAESLRNVYGLLADAERERDDAIAYGRSIVKELAMVEQRRDDVISQRDNLQQQRDYYQGSKDELVSALRVALTELEKSSLDALSLDRMRERSRVWVKLRDALDGADEL